MANKKVRMKINNQYCGTILLPPPPLVYGSPTTFKWRIATIFPPLVLFLHIILRYFAIYSPGTTSLETPSLLQAYSLTNVHESDWLLTNISTILGPTSPGQIRISAMKHKSPSFRFKSIAGCKALYMVSSSLRTFSTTL